MKTTKISRYKIMATLQNADILKGSALMLFMNDETVGFATEHSVEMNVETADISTKDHGDFPAVLAQRITWTCSASNLYSEAGYTTYYQAMKTMSPVHIKFAQVSNYAPYGNDAEKGIVGQTGEGAKTAWTAGSIIAEGYALITNVSVNASAGDNATLSISFQGAGDLTSTYDASTSTPANPG